MAYLAPENWPVWINVDTDDTDLLNQIEISEIDSTILMSFLDESQMEYCDDEKLRSVIQSLEAELDPISVINNNPAAPNLECYNGDFDFSRMDMEMSSNYPNPRDAEMIEFQVGSSDH